MTIPSGHNPASDRLSIKRWAEKNYREVPPPHPADHAAYEMRRQPRKRPELCEEFEITDAELTEALARLGWMERHFNRKLSMALIAIADSLLEPDEEVEHLRESENVKHV